MSNIFNSIRIKAPKKNAFNLSHERKFSFNMGELVPVLLQEVVPGDHFKLKDETLLRLAPMLAPVMHRINLYTHYFFVPNRLVFNNWQNWITGGPDGKEAGAFPFIVPTNLTYELFGKGTLSDYFGIPPIGSAPSGIKLNALPFRGYTLIYNEFYRDQNLVDPIPFSLDETTAVDVPDAVTLRYRALEKDYFTSALPWVQRGDDVLLPMQIDGSSVTYKRPSQVFKTNSAVANGALSATNGVLNDPANDVFIDNIDSIDGSSVTINDLRRSIRLQEWLEKNARGGSRYIEQILSHFGVISSDARLQRPEFLGGSKNPVTISEVLSTVETADVPQGNMSGHGLSAGGNFIFNKKFEEHGFIIGIMSCMPRTAYSQGLEKLWFRDDKLDYYWPSFAQLGEQPINPAEIFLENTFDPTSDPFGYQSRYAEYKFKNSSVHGDFRDTLEFWHLSRKFATAPSLSEDFITCDPSEFERIFADEDPTSDKLWCQMYHNLTALRPMPVFGTPTL